jgi:quercetin dioxygenase-like cupin family protein
MSLRFFVLSMSLSAAVALAQQADKVSPDYKVEIDNAWVRVLRAKYAPHEKIPMHEHPAFVVVLLTDEHLKITGGDGKVRTVDGKAGEVGFREASKHAEENLSDKPFEAIVIELKQGPAHTPPVELDPVKLDPEHHIVEVDNERVRAIRTILPPHVKSPMHDHPHYVVVYLTDLHTTMKLADGRVVDNPRKPGDIGWRDAYRHQTEQQGEKTAMEIQVELK